MCTLICHAVEAAVLGFLQCNSVLIYGSHQNGTTQQFSCLFSNLVEDAPKAYCNLGFFRMFTIGLRRDDHLMISNESLYKRGNGSFKIISLLLHARLLPEKCNQIDITHGMCLSDDESISYGFVCISFCQK